MAERLKRERFERRTRRRNRLVATVVGRDHRGCGARHLRVGESGRGRHDARGVRNIAPRNDAPGAAWTRREKTKTRRRRSSTSRAGVSRLIFGISSAVTSTILVGPLSQRKRRALCAGMHYLTVNSTLSLASSSVSWSAATTRNSSVCLPGLMPLSVPFSLSNMPISSPST